MTHALSAALCGSWIALVILSTRSVVLHGTLLVRASRPFTTR